MTTEFLLLLGFAAIVLGTRFIPPEYKYLSSRKCQAIRLALCDYLDSHDDLPTRPDARIYQCDPEKCIVMIPYYIKAPGGGRFLHPIFVFYSVKNGSNEAEYIGSGDCRFGIQPEDIWQEYALQKKEN